MPTSTLLAGQVIGILTDGPGARPFFPQQALEAEIRSLTAGEFDVSFPANKQLNGNWSAIGISAALDQLLNNPDVDIILCLSVLSSQKSVQSSPVVVVDQGVLAGIDPTLSCPIKHYLNSEHYGSAGAGQIAVIAAPTVVIRGYL